jgi:hypothetical protein
MPNRSYNLGRILPKFKGNYTAETEYNYLDIVYYNGSSYVAKQTTTGNVPTNTTYWDIVAAAGQMSGTLTADQITAIVTQVLATAGLVVDASYVHTDNNLTNAMVAAIGNITTPGTGVLTIKKNGTTIGTFSADAAGNTTIDLTVPTSVADLNGGSGVFKAMGSVKLSGNAGVIEALKPAMVYRFLENLTSLQVSGLSYSASDSTKLSDTQHSFLYFTAGASFVMTIPAECKCNTTAIEEGYTYKVEVEGNLFTVTKYQ